MEFINTISGSAALIKRYQASATLSTAGVPLLGALTSSTDIGSVVAGTASGPIIVGSQAGVSLDTTGTVAASGTVEADILVSVIINPDAIYRVKMSGGAASDTALTAVTSGASATALTIDAVTVDNALVWGYTGSNVGVYRRADDATGGVSINFPVAAAQGDTYLTAHGYPAIGQAAIFYDLTTELDQIDSTVVSVDMDNFICVDAETTGGDQDGINNSYYHMVQNNSMFGNATRV